MRVGTIAAKTTTLGVLFSHGLQAGHQEIFMVAPFVCFLFDATTYGLT
jgi:hypothetical protein